MPIVWRTKKWKPKITEALVFFFATTLRQKNAVLAADSFKIESEKWVTLLLEVRGSEMAAQIADGPPIRARVPCVDMMLKQINLPTRGGGVVYHDKVRIWEAKKQMT